MANKEYQRLTRARRATGAGFGAAVATLSSLWLGADHLLSINVTGYTEEYKRFYYRDIQGIIVRRTHRRLILSAALAVPLILFLLIALAINDPVGSTSLAIFTVLPLSIALVYNLVAGPTTACFLRTAVQTEELPSLNRLRRVRKALLRLRPLIITAQGQLLPEEIPALMQQLAAERSPTAPAPPGALPPVINP